MEVVQRDKEKAEAFGFDLRVGSSRVLRRRRGIFGLFLAASASMSVVALYQLGILKRLPDPPLPQFDSGKVTGSAKAYKLLETPDAVLAIASYAMTMTLVAMGSPDRASQQPLLPLALAAKVGFDAVMSGTYAIEEWRKHRTLCSWCLFAAVATSFSMVLAIPEARSAIHRLK